MLSWRIFSADFFQGWAMRASEGQKFLSRIQGSSLVGSGVRPPEADDISENDA